MHTSPTEFTLFSNLPYEIRATIWQWALPGSIGPTLRQYKTGFWQLQEDHPPNYYRLGASSRKRYDAHLRFDLLCQSYFEVPLFLVNHEAHAIAIRWMEENKVALSHSQISSTPFRFSRQFNPALDVIYIASDMFDIFIDADTDNLFSMVEYDSMIYDALPEINCLAVAVELLQNPEKMSQILDVLSYVNKLFVISKPGASFLDKESSHRRWEYKCTQDDFFFVLKHQELSSFGTTHPANELIYTLVQESLRELLEHEEWETWCTKYDELRVQVIDPIVGEGFHNDIDEI